MDAHSQLQDEIIRALTAVVMTPEATALLGGISVKGVWKLVDRPLTAEETPAVIVEIGHESIEYQDVEAPPNRIMIRTVQAIVIVTVNADLRTFAAVTRRLSEMCRKALAGFRSWGLTLEDIQVVGVAPEDYPSGEGGGRQAGHTLTALTKFWSRENDPGTILKLR